VIGGAKRIVGVQIGDVVGGGERIGGLVKVSGHAVILPSSVSLFQLDFFAALPLVPALQSM